MDIATLIQDYGAALESRYHARLLPSHRRALDAMSACRKRCGELLLQCEHCRRSTTVPLSCGHRSCPKCQHQDATAWLNRQSSKLLPVPYFMVTFTLPAELRQTAWRHQRRVYTAMFRAAQASLNALGDDPKWLGAKIGMTGVLHTHTRRLDYHPHIHFIVPGGGIQNSGQHTSWRSGEGNFLFYGSALAALFRGKLMYELIADGIHLPIRLPRKWVVDCSCVGRGLSALRYLSRYLYRGVIAERNIIASHNGQVTFSYVDSATKQVCYRTLKGEDFLWCLLRHVLPRGFRRSRDYGYLHPNARKKLALVQLILQVKLPAVVLVVKRALSCVCCDLPLKIVEIFRRRIPFNPLFHGAGHAAWST